MTAFRFASSFALMFCMTAGAATLNVPSQQYPTIQSAIDAAAAGDVVLVAPGPYTGQIDLRGKGITLKSSAGRAQTFIQPGAAAGPVVYCISGEPSTCIIEGFTILGANGTGIEIANSSPVVRACAINQNRTGGQNGGGSRVHGSSSPRFENCQFFGNRADGGTRGGAIAVEGSAVLTCSQCQFSANIASADGGAIYAGSGTLNLAGCSFTSNQVEAGFGTVRGGAVFASGSVTLNLTDCLLRSNVARGVACCNSPTTLGGAVYCSGPTAIVGCTFELNLSEVQQQCCGSTNDAWAGALCLEGQQPADVRSCSFVQNTATTSQAYARGGAIAIMGGCDPNFTDCQFTGNSASANQGVGHGGSMWYGGGSLGTVLNCTVAGSTATSEGGGAHLDPGARPTFDGTTFSNCSAVGAGGGLRAIYGAGAFLSECRFTNCSAGYGGGLSTLDSGVFVVNSSFDANSATSHGSAISSEGSGIPNVPTILGSFFCSNSGDSSFWISGNWNDPIPGSNSLEASCGSDCNLNGILDSAEIAAGVADDCDGNGQPDDCQADCDGDGSIDSCEIAGGAADCNTNGVPDSCEIAKGADDINNDGVLDSCEPVDFIGLRSEIVPIVNRSDDSTSDALPSTAVCYRLYAEFNGSGAAVWGVFGNEPYPLVLASPGGFHSSADAGDLTTDVPCSDSSSLASLRYDSWLTIGADCQDANALQSVGFKGLFLSSGVNNDNCGALVSPGSPQGFAGADNRVLIAQLTTNDGSLPTGSINIVGLNIDGTDLLAYGQTWPPAELVDCNQNGVHDAYDIRDGVSNDCNESGIPDDCEYANPDEDCNGNGSPDLCDIRTGVSVDVNGNTVPDECECEGDVDGDGTVNIDDVIDVIVAWGDQGQSDADLNGDGIVDGADFAIVLSAFGSCQ